MPDARWQSRRARPATSAARVSALDAAYVLQAVAGTRTLTRRKRLAGDVTGDGTLSALDATRILQLAVGAPPQFPAAQPCGSDWLFLPVPAGAANQSVAAPNPSAACASAVR